MYIFSFQLFSFQLSAISFLAGVDVAFSGLG
jgi:hypothetical protein